MDPELPLMCKDCQGSFGIMPELPWRSRHFFVHRRLKSVAQLLNAPYISRKKWAFPRCGNYGHSVWMSTIVLLHIGSSISWQFSANDIDVSETASLIGKKKIFCKILNKMKRYKKGTEFSPMCDKINLLTWLDLGLE